MNTTLIPAIDIRDGRVVRLQQGDYARQTTYAMDPLAQASAYAQAGAEWLHLVDLDAARLGGFSLATLVADVKRDSALKLQAGGGVRSREQLTAMFAAGVDRAVIGTLALTDKPAVRAWLSEFGPERLTLAFDVKRDADGRWRCASHGWTELSAEGLDDILAEYRDAGLRHVLCTDIARDGLLGGYNLALYAHLRARWPALQVQASGGVAGLDDIRAVKALGVPGAILGRALLEGRFTLMEAMAC